MPQLTMRELDYDEDEVGCCCCPLAGLVSPHVLLNQALWRGWAMRLLDRPAWATRMLLPLLDKATVWLLAAGSTVLPFARPSSHLQPSSRKQTRGKKKGGTKRAPRLATS